MPGDEMPEVMEPQAGGRSAWMSHVKRTMKANKGKSLKQVLKMAGKTYKKMSKRGGGMASVASTAGSVGGRRRRGGVEATPFKFDAPPAPSATAPTTFGKGKRGRTKKSKRRGGMFY